MGDNGEFDTETEFANLLTTNKKVIPAINEVFQCADSTINSMENAIGVPAEDMSYLSESSDKLELLNERLRRKINSSYESLSYKNLNDINKYGRNLLPVNFNICKLVSEDGKIEIPIDSNGQFTVDNINITSKTNFILKYNNGKYFKLPYGKFDLRLLTSSFEANTDLGNAIKVESTIYPISTNFEAEPSNGTTIQPYKRDIKSETVIGTISANDIKTNYNSNDNTVEVSSIRYDKPINPFSTFYISYNNNKIPLIQHYHHDYYGYEYVAFNSTDDMNIYMRTYWGSGSFSHNPNFSIVIQFNKKQTTFYDCTLLCDNSDPEMIVNSANVYNKATLNINKEKIATVYYDCDNEDRQEERDLPAYNPILSDIYKNNLLSIKCIINPSDDLTNKKFTIGIYDKSTIVNNINNLNYNFFTNLPPDIGKTLIDDYNTDSVFSYEKWYENPTLSGRTMSDSIILDEDLTLYNGVPIVLHMKDLPFYPTKVVFTLPYVKTYDGRYYDNITLVAYENPLLQDNNSSNEYFDPYKNIYIKMTLVGTDLIFTTNNDNRITFFNSDSLQYDGSIDNKPTFDILGRDYRYTAYADQSIKYINEYNYSEFVTLDNEKDPYNQRLLKTFDMIGCARGTFSVTYRMDILSTGKTKYFPGALNIANNSSIISTNVLITDSDMNELNGELVLATVLFVNEVNGLYTFTSSKPFLVKLISNILPA